MNRSLPYCGTRARMKPAGRETRYSSPAVLDRRAYGRWPSGACRRCRRRRSSTSWRWPASRGRLAVLADRLRRRSSTLARLVALDVVRVVERPHDEDVAAHAHDRQQHRADDREAEDAAQHDLAGPHRLGDDRVDRLRFEVVRQAERAEQQRDQQHQVGRRREHEAEIQLRRLLVSVFEKPAGEQQDQQEHRQRHDHAAAQRFLDRQPGQRPHAPRRGLEQLAEPAGDRAIGDVAAAQQALPRTPRSGSRPPAPSSASPSNTSKNRGKAPSSCRRRRTAATGNRAEVRCSRTIASRIEFRTSANQSIAATTDRRTMHQPDVSRIAVYFTPRGGPAGLRCRARSTGTALRASSSDCSTLTSSPWCRAMTLRISFWQSCRQIAARESASRRPR